MKYLKKLAPLIILVLSSHLINYGAKEFSDYATSHYVKSNKNPSLSILADGKLNNPEKLSKADHHNLATTTAVIKKIELFILLINATCQLLLVLAFSGLLSSRDRD